MARRLTSLSGRLVLIVLLIHAVLLPALFAVMSEVVRRNMVDAFIDDARMQGRLLADNLELDANDSAQELEQHLDSAVLGGRIVYAAIIRGDTQIHSSLMSDEDLKHFDEDYEFGDHDDDTYYLSMPIVSAGGMANLQLGFDETAAKTHFEDLQRSFVVVISVYLLVTVVAAVFLSSSVIRPIRWLQNASRAVASGEYDKKIETDSRLAEINALTEDLELMRGNLVKVNTRLRHAQRLESLGTLAGGVAHEFNNVLQPMLLYTDLALEDLPGDSPIAANMRRVLELAHRAKGLSQQILTFGRLGEEGQLQVLRLEQIVEEAITMIRALLPATVDIRISLEANTGYVRCDPGQIHQLVINLCNNAYQALETGAGHIAIALYRESVGQELASRHPHLDAADYVVLEVADTGHGMDRETLERIYEPFFTTQDVGEGTGLGLSVVHGIVRRHDGEIMLTSEPGEGTKFRIYLPRVDAAGQDEYTER
ncbi:MAG: ATP-binding protein [Woeseiaceae bacterium]|jgi:signal transduction histidine kinase